MKRHPVNQNLDTSFVDLSALLEYLRRQKFVGMVHLEMNGYEADVFLTEDNRLEARENDRIAGRVSAGAEVLEHLLKRAEEPGGAIVVYQTVTEPPAVVKKPVPVFNKESAGVGKIPEIKPKPVSASPSLIPPETEQTDPPPVPQKKKKKPDSVSLKEKLGLPNLPFSFTNNFEKKAGQQSAGPEQDWHELLELSSELLHTVEKCLAREKLNFAWIFDRVRVEMFKDYPFLQPDSTVFAYRNGRVSMSEQINKNLFAASILESLRRILENLEDHPKFAVVHRSAVENLQELLDQRQAQFDRFAITSRLRRIIGI